MKLFYGADTLVQKPVFNMGNPSNDYGLGFYMTPDRDMARLRASKNEKGGYCIVYDVDMASLNILNMEEATQENVLAWISMLVQHRFSRDEYEAHRGTIDWLRRNHAPSLEGIDMVIGYRADDSYFAYSRDFVANELSIEALGEAMHLGKLGLQYVLISRKSFERIRMVSYEKVDHTPEYETFRRKALDQYRALKADDDINNTFIRDIMRREGAGRL